MRALLLLPLFSAACVPTEPVDFGDPSLLAPLEEENLAPDPTSGAGLSMVSGHREDEDPAHYWGHARGLVAYEPGQVWQALRNIDVVTDRREVDEYTYEENVLPEYDFSYVVHTTVRNPVTVNFDLTWVHELQDGSIPEPTHVVIRWDKTDGTQFINILRGSIVLTQVDGGTEVAFQEHLASALRDETTIEQFLTDVFADLEAELAGQPLPSFE